MLGRRGRLIALLLCLVSGPGTGLRAQEADGYRLNPGDVIRLSVWQEEDLTREAIVQPDGGISFPLAGQLKAAGRTADELQAEVTTRIERYIASPVVTIELLEARGNRIYVLGEVRSPGTFQLDRPTSIVQAIALAGGFTEFAGRGRLRLLRQEDGVEKAWTFDYDDVAGGRALDSNIELKAGDTVIVPGGSIF